jgi:hypothetical protein
VPRGRICTRIHCALLTLLLIPAHVWAQNATPSSSTQQNAQQNAQETIAQLVEQIKQLQQQDRDLLERIKILEAKQPPASPVAETDPTQPPPPSQPPEQIPQPPVQAPMPRDWHAVRGIQWRGFGEVD